MTREMTQAGTHQDRAALLNEALRAHNALVHGDDPRLDDPKGFAVAAVTTATDAESKGIPPADLFLAVLDVEYVCPKCRLLDDVPESQVPEWLRPFRRELRKKLGGT